uniref:Uncharacterized protein n=1 Tax=Meloidogyne incognita TaxID=6306 RepID=A0A914MS32_MELIC
MIAFVARSSIQTFRQRVDHLAVLETLSSHQSIHIHLRASIAITFPPFAALLLTSIVVDDFVDAQFLARTHAHRGPIKMIKHFPAECAPLR